MDEVFEKYDFQLIYHPRKANVVADSLSRGMDLYVERSEVYISYGMIIVTSSFLEVVKEKTKELLGIEKAKDFHLREDDILRCKRRIFVIKREVAEYIATCLTCQKAKIEH
ncbi:hypothetical protein CR513_43004, partial [Mucuna pruriens]